jgi:hypothetical protein
MRRRWFGVVGEEHSQLLETTPGGSDTCGLKTRFPGLTPLTKKGSSWPQGSVWNAREGLEVAVNAIGDIPASSHVHIFSLRPHMRRQFGHESKSALAPPVRNWMRTAHARMLAIIPRSHRASAIQLNRILHARYAIAATAIKSWRVAKDVKVDSLARTIQDPAFTRSARLQRHHYHVLLHILRVCHPPREPSR